MPSDVKRIEQRCSAGRESQVDFEIREGSGGVEVAARESDAHGAVHVGGEQHAAQRTRPVTPPQNTSAPALSASGTVPSLAKSKSSPQPLGFEGPSTETAERLKSWPSIFCGEKNLRCQFCTFPCSGKSLPRYPSDVGSLSQSARGSGKCIKHVAMASDG